MKGLRKLLASIVGFPLLAIGLILIPLPGPGVLVCFAALFVLSFGFDWANKYLERCKAILRKIYSEAKARADRIEKKSEDSR